MVGMELAPWWAALTTWAVVNAVNLAQAAGFASRPRHGMAVNHALGFGIAALAVPATVALIGFAWAGNPWWIGPAAFDAFVVLMLVVDYLRPVQWRRPMRPAIAVPYLVLFFGSILLMGIPMYWADRGLWLVTVVTSALLVVAMTRAVRQGDG
jgi:hypothetical protein